jgi:hypothetical protein
MRFARCPRCGITTDDVEVFECPDCERYFCGNASTCSDFVSYYAAKCPDCDRHACPKVGVIDTENPNVDDEGAAIEEPESSSDEDTDGGSDEGEEDTNDD